MVKEILLTGKHGKGLVTLIDDEDYDKYGPTFLASNNRNGIPYARLRGASPPMLHRVIMGLDKGDKRQVDHLNGDTLDNRKENLEVVTQSENMKRAYAKKKKKARLNAYQD